MIRARYRERLKLDPVRRMAMEQRAAYRRARIAMRASRTSGDWRKSNDMFYEYVDSTARPWDWRVVPTEDYPYSTSEEIASRDAIVAAANEWCAQHPEELTKAYNEALVYGRSYTHLSPSIVLRESLDQVQGTVRLG